MGPPNLYDCRSRVDGGARQNGREAGDYSRHRRDLTFQLACLPAQRMGARSKWRVRSAAGSMRHSGMAGAWSVKGASRDVGSCKTGARAWTGVIVLPAGAHFNSAVDFKAPERRKISEQGYTIILTMGDQDSDLNGGYAERGFKLPNPVYFLP